jgi:hypothetical protein
VIVCVAGAARPAHAERVHDLARALVHGKHVKTRVSAASALGRLRDRRALRSLTLALGDASYLVRELAAVALGNLGDPAALPALERARADKRRAVRRQVLLAIDLIRARSPRARGVAARTASPAAPVRGSTSLAYPAPVARPGEPLPIYVQLKSISDKSADAAAARTRRQRTDRMRSLMSGALARGKDVTLLAATTSAATMRYAIDLTLMKLSHVERGPHIEVECEIRVAISTQEGKMLSFLTGGAKVQVPRGSFREDYLPQLRGEAIEGAVRSVHADLAAFLKKLPRDLPDAVTTAGPSSDGDDLAEKNRRQ